MSECSAENELKNFSSYDNKIRERFWTRVLSRISLLSLNWLIYLPEDGTLEDSISEGESEVTFADERHIRPGSAMIPFYLQNRYCLVKISKNYGSAAFTYI